MIKLPSSGSESKAIVSDRENLVPLSLAIALNVSARGNLRTEGLKRSMLQVIVRSFEESM